jgi:hypothetical protein
MKFVQLTHECKSFHAHMNSDDHTADFFWRAEGGTFGSETRVGIKSILIYPMRYETNHGKYNKIFDDINRLKDLPRECAGRFNPCKVITSFTIQPRTSYASCYYDSPGKFTTQVIYHDS